MKLQAGQNLTFVVLCHPLVEKCRASPSSALKSSGVIFKLQIPRPSVSGKMLGQDQHSFFILES